MNSEMNSFRIWVGDEELYLSPKELSILKIYKGSEDLGDFKTIGVDITQSKYPFVDAQIFNNKGVNWFCMFLENPSYELATKIGSFSHVRIVIDEIKTLIDIACRYGLKEGPKCEKIYRYENKANLKTTTGLLNSFKSFSRLEGGIPYFKNINTTLIETSLIGCYPHFYMESIPVGYIEGEGEILLPPYIKYKFDSDILSLENGKMLHMNVCCIPEDVLDDETDYEKAIQTLESIENIGSEELISDLKPILQSIQHNIKKYAFKKYTQFINECKIKYSNNPLMNNTMEFEKNDNFGVIQATLNKGKYYSQDDVYYLEFAYPSLESKRYMQSVFNQLVLDFGGPSQWAREHKTCIMPYLIDDSTVGGTNVPIELLYYLIKKIVEENKCTVTCGSMVIKDKFDEKICDEIIRILDGEKTEKRH